MSDLMQAIMNNMKNTPDKVAIICEQESITYGVLEEHMCKMSQLLLESGVRRGDHIGVLLPNCIEFVEWMLIAANIDAAIVPISATLPLDAIQTAFEASEVTHMVANEPFYKKLNKAEIQIGNGIRFCVQGQAEGTLQYQEWIQSAKQVSMSMKEQEVNTTGNEPYIFTLTSGSTGTPKPIVLTQNNKYNRAMSAVRSYHITAEDIILAATPLYHSLAERLVLLPLIAGGTSVIMPRFSPSEWLKCVERNQVSFTIAVSSQLNKIAETLSSPFIPDISSLRCVVSSSALLENHVKVELLSKLQCDFHECYGTSEIAVATNLNLSDASHKLKTVGKAIEEADVKILTEDNRIAQVGEHGEIICKTSLLFAGYYRLPELLKQAMYGEYFKTGDTGYLDEEGFLYFLGRNKDIIISGGVNIYPSDIEEVVGRLPDIAECAAFPYPDDNLGEVIALAVVMKPDTEFQERETKFYCAKQLADYQQPRKYYVLEELPKNAMGKLMKQELIRQLVVG